MSDGTRLRASDADREEAAAPLRTHFAAGRITEQELDERLEAVYAARTAGELDALAEDLPAVHLAVALDAGRELRRRRLYQDAGAVVIASVACVAIWLAVGAHGQFWPAWIILVGTLRLLRDGWRLLGPGADLEGEPPGRRRDRHGDRRSW